MKIKLEITMDNGSVDRYMLDGNPAPESIMELVNKLTSFYNAAVEQSPQFQGQQFTQTAVNTSQQIQPQIQLENRPQVQPHTQSLTQQPHTQQSHTQPQIQPNYTKQYISQPPQQQPQNIGGTCNLQIAEEEYSRLKNESLTIKQRLELFINFEYKDQWFTSLEVKKDYDRVYGNINLSTVSTYLSRMYRENKLDRMGNRNQRKYRIREEFVPQECSFNTAPSFDIRT